MVPLPPVTVVDESDTVDTHTADAAGLTVMVADPPPVQPPALALIFAVTLLETELVVMLKLTEV